MQTRATTREKKITAILLLFQNHSALINLLVDASTQSLSVKRANALLEMLDENPNQTMRFLILTALDIWLETEQVDLSVLSEFLYSADLKPAISGIKYYLES